jgi:hypothetical protein
MPSVAVAVMCKDIATEGAMGPGARYGQTYTLEGVSHVFRIEDPSAEPPFYVQSLWLYLRLYWQEGDEDEFELGVRFSVLGNDGRYRGVELLMLQGRKVTRLERLQFRPGELAMSLRYRFSDLSFPRESLYRIRILMRRRGGWRGTGWKRLGDCYFSLEKRS